EGELHAVHLEEALVLLEERVLGAGEDVDERLLVQLVERRDDGQTTDELGDEPGLEEVFGLHLREQLADALVLLARDLGPEPEAALPGATLDDLVEAHEGAAADEEDVGGVDLQELLLRMLAPALGRHVG